MFQNKKIALYYKGEKLTNLEKINLSARKDTPYLTVEALSRDDQFDFYVVEQISLINDILRVSVVTVEESLKKTKNISIAEKVIDIRDWQSRPRN